MIEVTTAIIEKIIYFKSLFWLKRTGFIVQSYSSYEFSTPWLDKKVINILDHI
jgi:hypothetical protein